MELSSDLTESEIGRPLQRVRVFFGWRFEDDNDGVPRTLAMTHFLFSVRAARSISLGKIGRPKDRSAAWALAASGYRTKSSVAELGRGFVLGQDALRRGV